MSYEEFGSGPENPGGDQLNYFGMLKNIHVPTLKKNMAMIFSSKEGPEGFKAWMEEHAPAVMEQYLQALQQGVPEAIITSFNDVCMYCHVVMKTGMKPQLKASDKPIQSTSTQKEVEEKFSDDNVTNAVDDLFNELGFEVGDDPDDPESKN